MRPEAVSRYLSNIVLNQPNVTGLQVSTICNQCNLHCRLTATSIIIVVQTTGGLVVDQILIGVRRAVATYEVPPVKSIPALRTL
jgi:hypothetical protein